MYEIASASTKITDSFVQPVVYVYNTQEHRPTQTSPFSLSWNWKPLRAQTNCQTTIDDIRQLTLAYAKLKVKEKFQQARATAGKASSTRNGSCAEHFIQSVCQRFLFWKNDLIYIGGVQAFKATEFGTLEINPSQKLRPKTDCPFLVIKVRDHTLTVSVNDTHWEVSTDRVSATKTKVKSSPSRTPASTAQSDGSTNTQRRQSQPSKYHSKLDELADSMLVDDC